MFTPLFGFSRLMRFMTAAAWWEGSCSATHARRAGTVGPKSRPYLTKNEHPIVGIQQGFRCLESSDECDQRDTRRHSSAKQSSKHEAEAMGESGECLLAFVGNDT